MSAHIYIIARIHTLSTICIDTTYFPKCNIQMYELHYALCIYIIAHIYTLFTICIHTIFFPQCNAHIVWTTLCSMYIQYTLYILTLAEKEARPTLILYELHYAIYIHKTHYIYIHYLRKQPDTPLECPDFVACSNWLFIPTHPHTHTHARS